MFKEQAAGRHGRTGRSYLVTDGEVVVTDRQAAATDGRVTVTDEPVGMIHNYERVAVTDGEVRIDSSHG